MPISLYNLDHWSNKKRRDVEMSGFSVRKPYTIFVGVVMILLLGVIAFRDLTTDLLPSMELPYVAIITTYPGASPEKVEEAVSKPVEQGMMGISNIEDVRSTSSENYSMVFLEFSGDSNMDSIMIEISQELDILKANFEEGVSNPTVMQINPDMMPVMLTTVDMENADSIQITEFVENTLLPELESVDGVASVETYGAIENEIKIQLNQSKIDSINNKMLEHVSSELAKQKREIDKAASQINSGKAQLEQTKQEKGKEIAEGISALEAGRNEITKAEIELGSKETELTSKKAELEASLSQIGTAETELLTQKQALESQKQLMDTQIDTLESTKTTLEATKTELQGKISSGEATMEENVKLTEIETQLFSIDSSLQALKSNEGYQALVSGLDQINQKYTELTAGKEQIAGGLAQISNGLRSKKKKKKYNK